MVILNLFLETKKKQVSVSNFFIMAPRLDIDVERRNYPEISERNPIAAEFLTARRRHLGVISERNRREIRRNPQLIVYVSFFGLCQLKF